MLNSLRFFKRNGFFEALRIGESGLQRQEAWQSLEELARRPGNGGVLDLEHLGT